MSLTSLLSSMNRTRDNRGRKPARRNRPLANTRRAFFEPLEERVLLAAMIYQFTPYGGSSYALSGTITADGPSGGGILFGAAASAAVSNWTVNINNLSTNVTTQYTGTGAEFTATGGLFFDGNTLRHGTGRGPGYFEFNSEGVSILKEEVYVVSSTARNFRVISEFGTIVQSGPHFNVFIPQLAFGGVPVPTNTPPGVAADAAAVSTNEGGTLTNTGTFSDAQGNSTVSLTASAGAITPDNANGTWSWSLNAADGSVGPISVTITANDGVAAPVTTSFDYSVNNLNPTAVDDVFGESEGGIAQALALLGNDTDPAGANDPLSITGIDTTGTIGLATLDSGQVSYSPDGQFESLGAGEMTDDTFTYSISDGDGGTDTATVTVTITGQNDAPTAIGTLSDVTVNQNAANSVISLTGLFHDVDANDTLTITTVSSSNALVTAGVAGSSLTLDYQANQSGTATITVTATDGSGVNVDLTFNVAVLSPDHLANGIIQLINQWKSDGKINAGVANSMIVKVVNSLKSYDNGNLTAAGNQLSALKNEISAKIKPGLLTAADETLANTLIDELFDSMSP